MSVLRTIKLGLVTLVAISLLAFAVICIRVTWQETFARDYDSHLTQKEYTSAVIDENVNLVFYKVGCPYCQAGKKAVITTAEKSAYPTFYINVESEEGQVLVKKYQVKKAASLVTIRNGQSHLYLYAAKDKQGKITADEKTIKEALDDSKNEAQ